MSFLSAAFLLALPLVAVPVAIHLYRGRQRDVILWGAMQFLASAVTRGRRMERLEELLLMLLRLAAVAALVFALARPMVRSSWLGHQTDRQVILIVDNSLSTSRTVDGESPAQRMKEQALDAIDSLAGTDGVQLLLAAGSEWATAADVAADSAGRRKLRQLVEDVEPTLGTADLLGTLQAAVDLEAAAELAGRRIVVFTDGQASSWRIDAMSSWQQLAASRSSAKFPISIEVVDCGLVDAAIDNLAVADVRSAQPMIRPGEHVQVAAEVRNAGDVSRAATRVEWLVDGEVVQATPVRPLSARTSTRITTTLRLEESGIRKIACRLDVQDQVPLDQEDGLVIEVADQLPVLFVGEAAAGGRTIAPAELFSAALGYRGKEAQTWHSVFRPEVIASTALATHSLADYRAIVINDPAGLDRNTADRLDAFVRAGGGLWLAIGEGLEPAEFNRDWFSEGTGLAPLPLDSLELVDRTDDAAATVHPPSRDHPATVQLANTTQLDIDEARIHQRWKFGDSPATRESVSVLLESGNGRPLVVENYVGQGRVLVQAYPLGLEWSNVPLLKAYVVMIHDWLNYVTAPTTARYNLTPGAPIVASAPSGAAGVSAELVTPRGRAIPLAATDADFSPVFRYSQTRLPGTYRVRFTRGGSVSRTTEVPYHVARDPTESDLQPLAEEERDQLLDTAGITFGDAPQLASGATAPVARREPGWDVLLTALVVLLTTELLFSNWLTRQRYGEAVSTV